MSKKKPRQTIETFLTLILLIIFSYFIVIMVIESKNSFDRVSDSKRQDEDVRIALSYIQKLIIKNDIEGGIEILDKGVENLRALKVAHDEDGKWSTYVFFHDGILYENYTDQEPVLSLSTPLVSLKDIRFSWSDNKKQIIVGVLYNYQGEDIWVNQKTTLMTKDGLYE